jgi:hypothetical protein
MRRVIWTLTGVLALSFGPPLERALPLGVTAAAGRPAAAPSRSPDFSSADAVLRWINAYRTKPDFVQVPAAVRALSELGALRDTETAAVYVGFVSGTLRSHPYNAGELVEKMLPIKAEDHWFIVRAVAYSGIPNWREVLTHYADRMPTRQVMIQKYTSGKLPTLAAISFEKSPSAFERFKGYTASVGDFFTGHKQPPLVSLEVTSEVLDVLWGYYFATSGYEPVDQILHMLPWSKDRDNVERLTLGSMAKYTLVTNASHNHDLLMMLKRASSHQPKAVTPILNEIIEAADTMETSRIRQEALAAIAELKQKGPSSWRNLSLAGKLAEGTVSLGCIAAAVSGVGAAIGVPCVVGGAVGSAALSAFDPMK